jgi:flagellar hook-basal body complex protein FliE
MIKDVASLNTILKTGNTSEWIKSAQIEGEKATGLGDEGQITEPQSRSFSEMLSNSIMDVNNLQKEADKAIQNLVTGKTKNIDETMLAVERADIAFRAMTNIRSKVIEAYKEIMRMQI